MYLSRWIKQGQVTWQYADLPDPALSTWSCHQRGAALSGRKVECGLLMHSGCAGGAAAGADQVGTAVLHPQAVSACQVRLSPQRPGATARCKGPE